MIGQHERPTVAVLTERVSQVVASLRRTPTIALDGHLIRLFAKLENTQPFSGSTKDRSVVAIIKQAVADGAIGPTTTVVESSSGNFAVAAALVCARLGIEFLPVLDWHVNPHTERLLRAVCRELVVVEPTASTTSGLEARRACVAELLADRPKAWWPDQYVNRAPVAAHRDGTAAELLEDVPDVDEIYVAVGTGGTLAGIVAGVRAAGSRARVVAVDSVGSTIFGGCPGPRHIPGMGSTRRSEIVDTCAALVDEVVLVPEADSIRGCRELVRRYGILAGGSTGAVYAAIASGRNKTAGKRIAFLVADRGAPYLETVYDDAWVQATYGIIP